MRVSIILIIFSVLLISSIALANAEVDWEKKYKFLFKKLIDSRLQVAELKGEIIELQNALKDRPVVEPVIIENKHLNLFWILMLIIKKILVFEMLEYLLNL